MILAAAACAERKGPPPPELTLAWQSRSWGALPEGGGLRDQRAGDLARMSAALNTYEAVREWRSAKAWASWSKEHPEQWEIVSMVLRMRKANGSD
jgi:hypothetical protein